MAAGFLVSMMTNGPLMVGDDLPQQGSGGFVGARRHPDYQQKFSALGISGIGVNYVGVICDDAMMARGALAW